MKSIIFLSLALIGNTLVADERDALIAKLQAEIFTLKAELLATKQPAAIESKIVMETISGCEACERWWAAERMELIRVGWQVERAQVQPRRGKLYPRWRVCIGDSCQEVDNARSIMPRLRQIVDARNKRVLKVFE